MNIEYIEAFLETVRLGSIAKASEQLLISHPALSKQIRSLETYFGVTLFKRSSSGVELTENGRLFYNRIVPVFAEIRAIKSDMHNVGGSRKITIGTLPSIAAHFLPQVIYTFDQNQIQSTVIVRHTSAELYEMLHTGDLDAALLERSPESNSSYWYKELFEEPYDLVIYRAHPWAQKRSVTIPEISDEPLILNPPGCSTRRLITRLMAEYDQKPWIKSEVEFGDFILGYVAAGAGMTVVPRMVSDRLESANLIAIPIEDDRAKRVISLVTLSGRTGKLLERYFDSYQTS